MPRTKSLQDADVHVGTRIKARRLALGLSQEKLADQIGITFQQVQKYERGVNRVSASRLVQIGGVLGCRMEYFFQGIDPDGVSRDDAKAIAFAASVDGRELIEAWPQLNSTTRRAIVNVAKAAHAA